MAPHTPSRSAAPRQSRGAPRRRDWFTGSEAGMAHARDLCFTPATELVRLFRARRVSPLELMHALLARIDAVNPTVNAIVTLARESALAEARRATAALRRNARLGPLHGVP